MKKIGLLDIKAAMKDGRFRDSLPLEYGDDIAKWLNNPKCGCNIPLYKKIMADCKDQLRTYFGEFEVKPQYTKKENNFIVINCHIDEIDKNLKLLGPGAKQIALSRYEDQVTLIINEID